MTPRLHLTFVLLVLQASNAALATLVQWLVAGVFGALATSGVQLGVSVVGSLGLLLLAVGALREWRNARRLIYVVEGLMLLGTLPRILQGAQAQALPEGAWLLANIGLPAAVLLSLRLGDSMVSSLPALFLLTSGLIHLGLAGEHSRTTPQVGLLFTVDGLLLIGLGIALLFGRRWRRPVALILLANLLAYLVAIGPGKEPLDSLGLATKLLELVALGLVLLPRSAAEPRPGRAGWLAATSGIMLCALLTGTVTWAAAWRANGPATNHHLQASAGWSLAAPTVEERAAAEDLLVATRISLARYEQLSNALAAGYHPTTGENAPTVHYMNAVYEHDDHYLDPSRPEGLVYANTASGPLLLGAVFTMPRVGLAGPTPGGAITHWHTHDNLCISLPMPTLAGLASPLGICPPGTFNVATPDMMHVWIIDNPGGPFADDLPPTFVAHLSRR